MKVCARLTIRITAREAAQDRLGIGSASRAAAKDGMARTKTVKTNHPRTISVNKHAVTTVLCAIPCTTAKYPTDRPKKAKMISAQEHRDYRTARR